MKPGLRLACAAVALATVSCASHPWYLVESTYDPDPEALAAEIVRTPTYRRMLSRIAAVAVSAPSRCAPLSPTEATAEGGALVDDLGDSPLRKSECGIELAEFERALVRSGYRVISWDAVNQMVVHGYLTPLEAARGLGADVLFQLNALERVQIPDDEGWQRAVYTSNAKGIKGAPATVPAERERAIAKAMRSREKARIPSGQVAISIDLTAVMTRNGEAIWFYEAVHRMPVDASRPVTQLFVCNRKVLSRCIPRKTPGRPTAPAAVAASTSAREQREEAYAGLLRDSLEIVVAEFRSGDSGG